MRSPFQQVAHFFIGYLREVFVPLPNGKEGLRLRQAHEIIHLGSDFFTGLRRSNRDGNNNAGWLLLAERGDRSQHARAGSDPIVHEDHRAPCGLEWRTIAPVKALASFQLTLFCRCQLIDHSRGNTQPLNDLLAQDTRPTCSDSAQRELLLAGNAQLAHHEKVERSVERSRHLESDRNAAPREGKYRYTRITSVGRQLGGEFLACFGAISK